MDLGQKSAELFELTESFDVPTFIVGGDGKISYKNKAARSARIPVRVGASIKNYVSVSDMKRLTEAENYEPVPLSLSSDRIYNCIVQKSGGDLVVKLFGLSALSLYRLDRFAEYTESKLKSNALLINALLKSGEKAEISNDIAKRLLCMIKLQTRMTDYIRYCSDPSDAELVTVSVGDSVKPVVSAINAFLPSHGVSIAEVPESGGIFGEYIRVNKHDFASMITYLVSFAVRYFRGNTVTVKADRYENCVVISAEGETVLPDDAVKLLCNFRVDRCFSSHHDLMFSMAVSKALAAHYGWRYDVMTRGIGLSWLKVLLSVPLCDDRPPLDLHSPSDISPMISMIETEFSDL